MENILEINNLKKTFSGRFGVHDVSFCLPKGFIMGFVGKNGAGKTTTIKCILNMLNKESGEIKIFGKDNLTHEADVKSKIGAVMDNTFFEENWTLLQTGKALKPFYPNWNDSKFVGLLHKFQLDPNKRIKGLSRGMKMKIMIACALAHSPDFLILDEPTSGLDAVARDELMSVLQEFMRDENKAILFSTHITSDLEKIADYITFIHDGRIIYTGTKDAVLEEFIMVKGGLGSLNTEQQKLIIGYEETSVGFNGVVNKEQLAKLPTNIITERVSLDDLVVRFNKGGSVVKDFV